MAGFLQKVFFRTKLQDSCLHSKKLPDPVVALINASLAKSSWNKVHSAWNCWKKFTVKFSKKIVWPFPVKDILEFIAWTSSFLKTNSIRAYISSLSYIHKLNSVSHNFDSEIVKVALRGAENLQFYKTIIPKCKKAFTLPLLKILSHNLANSAYSKFDKQVLWTAFSIAFFGSFRFGELLPENNNFIEVETLCWNDIFIKKDRIQIHIKITKSRTPKGEFIDLFPFTCSNYCPVKALKKLHVLCKNKSNELVFMFESKKALPVKKLNDHLFELLSKSIGSSAKFYSGHSFRAALPAALAACPHIANDEDVRYWGRWNSDAFKHYTKLQPIQRRNIFDKIVSCLSFIQ